MSERRHGIISRCTPTDLHLVCEDCGQEHPCHCEMYRWADDVLNGWTCPDCGERLEYEGMGHRCISNWDRYYNPLEDD